MSRGMVLIFIVLLLVLVVLNRVKVHDLTERIETLTDSLYTITINHHALASWLKEFEAEYQFDLDTVGWKDQVVLFGLFDSDHTRRDSLNTGRWEHYDSYDIATHYWRPITEPITKRKIDWFFDHFDEIREAVSDSIP